MLKSPGHHTVWISTPLVNCACAKQVGVRPPPCTGALCLSRRWAWLRPSERCSNAKTPHNSAGFCYGVPDDDLLSQARSPLSSALRRFTFLFEMEKGWDHLAIFVKLNWFWSVCSTAASLANLGNSTT